MNKKIMQFGDKQMLGEKKNTAQVTPISRKKINKGLSILMKLGHHFMVLSLWLISRDRGTELQITKPWLFFSANLQHGGRWKQGDKHLQSSVLRIVMSGMGDGLLLATWRNLDFVMFCVLEISLFSGEDRLQWEKTAGLFIKRFIAMI